MTHQVNKATTHFIKKTINMFNTQALKDEWVKENPDENATLLDVSYTMTNVH